MTLEWAPSTPTFLSAGPSGITKKRNMTVQFLSSSSKKQAGTNCFRHNQFKKPNLIAPIVESSSVLASRDLIMRSSRGLSYVKSGQRDAGTKCNAQSFRATTSPPSLGTTPCSPHNWDCYHCQTKSAAGPCGRDEAYANRLPRKNGSPKSRQSEEWSPSATLKSGEIRPG